MAITQTQGYETSYGVYRGGSGITWADLGSSPYGSWTNWTEYKPVPQNVIVQVDDDLGSDGVRTPTCEIEYNGALTSIELKISSTGSFSGEETTIAFTDGVENDWEGGRYYRWTIEVEADGATLPQITDVITNYATGYVEELINSLSIPSTAVDSAGHTVVTNTISKVVNVQATTLQGGLYVTEDYLIDTQTTGSEYLRTAKSITNSGVALVTDQVYAGDYSFRWDSTDDFAVDNPDNYFNDSQDTTWEAWVRFDDIPNDTVVLALIQDKDNTDGYRIPLQLNLVWGGASHTLQMNVQGNNNINNVSSSTDPFLVDTWYHIAVTHQGSAGVSELFIDGVSQGTEDYGSAIGIDTTDQSRMALGCGISTVDGSFTGSNRFDGWMDNVRVSASNLYPTAFTPPAQLYDRTDTLFLLTEALSDTVLADFGADRYIEQQLGGIAVIESKNPLTIRVVDYQGNPWDGTVDVVIRGMPKIESSANGVSATV